MVIWIEVAVVDWHCKIGIDVDVAVAVAVAVCHCNICWWSLLENMLVGVW